MHKTNSMIAGASRGIGVNAVTPILAPLPSSAAPLLRSIYRSVRKWLAGRRADIQIISVQRGDFSMIT